MCPICISTFVLLAGSLISTGGLAAMAIKKLGGKNAPEQDQDQAKEKNNDPKDDDEA
jgi:hypothetical protein